MKDILVFGLGITGKSVLKTLKSLNISAHGVDNDEEIINELSEKFSVSKVSEICFNDYKTLVKSPGIPPNHPFLQEAEKFELEIISDLELSFRLFPDRNYINITGTNGKTTCSLLTYEMLKAGNLPVHLIGNIGVGMTWEIYNSNKDDFYIIETSSFQLHNTSQFKSWISTIINLNEDHLDWHGDYESYERDKFKVFNNQDSSDYSIINIDDLIVCDYSKNLNSKKIAISLKEETEGFFYKNGKIIDGETCEELVFVEDLKIKGLHNVQNALIASTIAKICGVSNSTIRNTLLTFTGLEHRLEFVGNFNNRAFYNDSKATNPESTILAIESFDSVILIAGGYDKKIDFESFFNKIKDKISGLVLIGDTKEYFYHLAKKFQMKNVYLSDNMEDAVDRAIKISSKEDTILLSPASASWGMYENFEQRGDHFKEVVLNKMGKYNE